MQVGKTVNFAVIFFTLKIINNGIAYQVKKNNADLWVQRVNLLHNLLVAS